MFKCPFCGCERPAKPGFACKDKGTPCIIAEVDKKNRPTMMVRIIGGRDYWRGIFYDDDE